MSNTIHTKERAFTLHGVEGRMFNKVLNTRTGLFVNQTFSASRPFNEEGYRAGSRITVEVRFDDNCGNGKQSFAITGHVQEPRARDWTMGGCIHEEIAKYFPELAHLIRWHLFDTSGPMHYVANTVYHASNRDSSGYEAGQPCQWDRVIKFGSFPITRPIKKGFSEWLETVRDAQSSMAKTNPNRPAWPPVPLAVAHDKSPGDTYTFSDKYTFNGFTCKWHECPFDTLNDAQEFADALAIAAFTIERRPTAYSKGKTRDLDAARRCAVWPEATDAELSAPPEELKAALLARAPNLIREFRADMEASGMLWEVEPSARANDGAA